VGHFRGALASEPGVRRPWFWPLVKSQEALFRRAVERHPNPSDEEVRQAAQQTAALRTAGQRNSAAVLRWWTAVFVVTSMITAVAALGLLSAFAAKGGVLMRGLGLAIVGPDGREVSRLRALARATISWSPVLTAFVVLGTATPARVGGLRLERPALAVLLLLVFIAGAIFALLNPSAGLQDRLARTRVVAR
jgi:RDD family